ncbi:acryloyl-CoA reductase [Staphylococcus lugdunensis]|uniref:Acryloyl-CoA reductase n=1 Tax=Staphylococcus lugdunensis TaxID=28035 RepID=A0A133QAE6_STALU|nr:MULTISPECIES: acryloyl-CoA reductase [Staphylococcus]AMG62245.1 quinone oxidoreductase [Staphylococcus lugdunensis]ARJ10771.1 oxidoreductase [Staphylococcus lugdunensis]ARJ13297.1 oxidoreductase [Staphylococcus lugdunensis]ARJ26800.1 oxidoreductase [Staphylococcus lugdunensis]AST60771.1 oxidoreductase [Staphylococcus lugdunensis]
MTQQFNAFQVTQDDDGKVQGDFIQLTNDDLPEGDVLVKVQYSSINYKDALATQDNNGVIKNYPMVPGIDLAGTIEHSDDPRYSKGQEVIVTSYDLGVSHFGGFSEYARVNSDWIVPLPEHLTLEETMIYGTAGYTAGLAIERLENQGMTIEGKEVLVRGASGGVGSLAVMMLSTLGYQVIASTGNHESKERLTQLGATKIIDRIEQDDQKPLASRTWQAAVDPIGGEGLSYVLKRLDYGGSLALIGLTGGNHFDSTVFPFILRGANILGIDSVFTPMKVRERVWRRLATDLRPDQLHDIKTSIAFKDLPTYLDKIINHRQAGRVVIDFNK